MKVFFFFFSPPFVIFPQNTPSHVSLSASSPCYKKNPKTITSKDSRAPHMLYLQLSSCATAADKIVKWFKSVQRTLDAPLHNYPIKWALMSSLSFCPEASPHSVCKVRVPSLPQFDSVKAWKQIKSCCFSQSCRDTEPVGTRLTRGSFATCCFLFVMRPEECWHKLGLGVFVLFFSPLFFRSSGLFMRRIRRNIRLFLSSTEKINPFFIYFIFDLSQLQWNNLFSRFTHALKI